MAAAQMLLKTFSRSEIPEIPSVIIFMYALSWILSERQVEWINVYI